MNRLIDFSSRFRILKGGKISLVVSAFLGSTIIANAAPSGGVVTSGNATISQSGNVTNINQSSGKASINWNDFSVKANEIVNFNQPNVNSITLNRVVGNEKSVIDGALNANGQVWILNSNGILFGKNASINTAGLLATTGELSDADFQNGNYDFKNSSSNSVINLGTIKVNNSSYVILAGKEVQNGGNIEAVKGKVHLVGADSYSVNLNGNSLVNLKVNKGVLDAMVSNSGNILANGGEIFLTTNAVDELLKGMVNNTGIIEANSLDGILGKVELFAHGGEAQVGGTIEAIDGFVETSGKDFTIESTTKVKADKWLIDPTNINIVDATSFETALNGGTDVTIQTDAAGSEDGDININDEIEWSTVRTLTLMAHNNININSSITATQGRLGLLYGFATPDGGTSDYYINAKVNLSAGNNFATMKGSVGDLNLWTVITHDNLATAIVNGGLGGNYVLGSDLDLSGIAWNPIGTSSTNAFTGNFDGLGHVIDNLSINDSNLAPAGLFGYTTDATIKNIGLKNINIRARARTGGLVGQANTTVIKNAFAEGTIISDTNDRIGGLVGYSNGSSIDNSYSKGIIRILDNSSPSQAVGGLVGWNYSMNSKIKNSYSSVKIALATDVDSRTNIGGLVGKNDGTITNSYYDNETNTQTMADSATYGKTKAEIVSALSSLEAWTAGGGGDGASVEGYLVATPLTLPQLVAFYTSSGEILFAGGFGTEDNPYTITNWNQLQNINHSNILTQGYYFSLLNDLGSSTDGYTTQVKNGDILANGGTGWTALGNENTKFTGTFDGLGHTIDSLYINNSLNYQGLFGYLSQGSTISNLGLTNANISAEDWVGSLVGKNEGTLRNTYSAKANVTGDSSVGILVGDHYGSIYSSYSSGDLKARTNVGGIAGYSRGLIQDSYSLADITTIGSASDIGGIVGENNANGGQIINSYASNTIIGTGSNIGGLVGNNGGSISNSYYDKTVNSANMIDSEAYGKTTKEMQTLATFENAGWSIEFDETQKKIYPYLTFDENGGAIWKVGKYATALNYILGTANTTYDGTNQSLTNFWTNAIFGDVGSSLVAGIDYKFVYDSENATVFKNAGTYNNISVVILNEDYELDETGTNTLGKFVIAKKDATVTANSDTKTYNGLTQNVSGFTATGLVGNETESVLTGITGATASGKNAGEYVTTLSGTDGNYNLTFVDGK
ncbi:hypothetical protein CP986_04310, partial [Arcobacter aquimarinus]